MKLPRTAVRALMGSAGVACAVVVAGCQQPTAVSQLPPPNFAAPAITPPPLAALPPKPAIAAVAKPVAPAPPKIVEQPTARAGIPREWVPSAPVRPWQWIVIHHSDTSHGNAAFIDRLHKARGWDGLGYDFVIGNGTDSRDGQVETGYRWTGQLIGAHTKTPDNRFNETGIGICLVGDFMVERPTAAQMHAVDRLVAYLMQTYHIPPDHILGHRDTKNTLCPGTYMSVADVRRGASQLLAAAGYRVPTDPRFAASTELLTKR